MWLLLGVMGIGETDGLLGNEESRRLWSEPYQIEVPRLADGKLGFSIVVEVSAWSFLLFILCAFWYNRTFMYIC